MIQDAGAYLGLPEGSVTVTRTLTVKEAIERIKAILDIWERQGFNTMNEAPDGELKNEFKQLSLAVGVKA